MKRVAVFVMLKVAELSALVFVPYWASVGVFAIFNDSHEHIIIMWVLGIVWLGLACCSAVMAFIIAQMLIPDFIMANWRLAGKITKEN